MPDPAPTSTPAASPTASVILSTHNSPRALEFVLTGYARQNVRGFEVLIADDGSREDTRDAIRRLRADLHAAIGVPLIHVWHPHKGYFGKNVILNRAIAASRGEYLIIGDGDVIPRHDFVRTHLELRRPRCFLGGADFRLSPEATQRLTLSDVQSGRAFEYAFLRSIGQPATRRRVKLLKRGWFTQLIDAVNFSTARWGGSNASAWREDVLRVGGFDESYRDAGKEDVDLGVRLGFSGVKNRHSRHNTICLHLHHGSGNYSDDGRRRNMAIFEEMIRERRTMARIGIADIKPGDHSVERVTPA